MCMVSYWDISGHILLGISISVPSRKFVSRLYGILLLVVILQVLKCATTDTNLAASLGCVDVCSHARVPSTR